MTSLHVEIYGENLAESSFGVVCPKSTPPVIEVRSDLLSDRGLTALSQTRVTLRLGSVIVSVANVPASLKQQVDAELQLVAFRDEVELAIGCAGAWGAHFRGVRFYAEMRTPLERDLSRRIKAANRKARRAFCVEVPDFGDEAGMIVAGVAHRAVRWLAGLSANEDHDGGEADETDARPFLSVSFHSPTLPCYALTPKFVSALETIARIGGLTDQGLVDASSVDQRSRVNMWADRARQPVPETVRMFAARAPLLLVFGPSSVHDELRQFVQGVLARSPSATDILLPATQLEHFWVRGEALPAAEDRTKLRYISFTACEITPALEEALVGVASRSPELQCVDLSKTTGVTVGLVEAMAATSARFVGVCQTCIVAESVSAAALRKCCFTTSDVSDRQLAFEAYVRAASGVAGRLYS
jgi:hypothetical protein